MWPWASLTISVCLVPSFLVPALHLVIFIFLGSELLSVQNNISSIIFIPVIIVFESKPKMVLEISVNTGSV